METNEIREAIMKKAREEADQIAAAARDKATALVEQSKEQKTKLVDEEKKKKIDEANREASKILAQADLKERQIILRQKDGIIKDILKQVREGLGQSPMEQDQIALLLKEIFDAFESKDLEVRLFVASKDREAVQKAVDSQDDLKGRIVEVKDADMLGGVIAESADGMISIDNSYERRLNMLMPRILPEVGKTLFGG